MFRISIGEYEVCCQADGLPDMLSEYQKRAKLAEDFGVDCEAGASVCFVSVGRPKQWPLLLVVQRYSPAGYGFFPGVILVPETHRLFVGAGRRLLAYDLTRPARLWEDEADCGFWSWTRHKSVVLMAVATAIAYLRLNNWAAQGSNL